MNGARQTEGEGTATGPAGKSSLSDLWALGLLGVLVVIFLLPAIALKAPVLHCDALNEIIPRAMATARALQDGSVPLWDFNTFAGARPFYAAEMPSLYLPMLPFSLLAHPADARQASVVLALFPFALHVLWAALGGYLFGRLVVRLHPAGAFTLGFAYALCPEMACQLASPQVVFFHLPWIMLSVARFMESGRTSWWCAGAILLALVGTTGQDNFTIRVYFIAGATAGLLWLFSFWGAVRHEAAEGGAAGPRPSLRALSLPRLLAAGAMFVVSVGLHGIGWLSLVESMGWMQGSIPMTHELASGITPESSMPPLYLATLFMPGFYGVLDVHGWGVVLKEQVTTLSAVSGGMFVMAAVLAALFALRCQPGRGEDRRQRVWTWIGLILLVGSLFTMMGRFTPVFEWFCAVLPWFFKFPHAVYYRFAVCWSVALLAGLGVSSLITASLRAGRGGRWPVVVICIGLALTAGATGLFWRVDSLRGYQALSLYGEWRWFLTRPVLHLAVASVVLLAIFTRLAPRRRGWALAIGAAAETILLAGHIVYVAPLAQQYRKPPDYRARWMDDDATQRRCCTLADYAPYRVVSAVRPLLDHPPVRVATFTSILDNQVWASDGRSLLGYAAKPLLPRFETAIEPFVAGQPFNLLLKVVSPAFMRNMNVGYFIAPEQRSFRWPVVMRSEGAVVYRLDTPLPWVYTQDCIVPADEAHQLEMLRSGDLREAVYVEPALAVRLPVRGAASPAAFAALQATNRVLRVDRSRSNRLTIEADMARPAMLVIAECWHPGWTATVDGRPVPVWQVNYLQQGLWLDGGRHTVKLAFMPESVRRGIAVSGASGAVFLLVAITGVVRARRRRRGPP